MQTDILSSLCEIIESRKKADPKQSYVASLHQKGIDAIGDKVLEEAHEIVDASKQKDRGQVVYETADLWFHSLVMLSCFNATHEDVLNELGRRFGVSGLEEKRARQSSPNN